MSEKKADALLFNNETTTGSHFRGGAIMPLTVTKYKPKGTCHRIRPRTLKDLRTLTDLKGPLVPFNLFWKKKEIIREHPSETQARFTKPEDHEREYVQKTRPRLVMTPATSLDDVPEPMRKQLLSSIYVTSTADLMKEPAELAAKNLCIKAPLPTMSAPANPLAIKKAQPPYVSPEWRMDSASWDRDRLRPCIDSTKEFWLRRRKAKCSACDETALLQAHRKMQRQLKTSR